MVVSGAKITWEVHHAREQAALRNVQLVEAERVVRTGTVTRIDLVGSQIRWRISGWDSDSRPVDVVVRPVGNSVLLVITVIRTDE